LRVGKTTGHVLGSQSRARLPRARRDDERALGARSGTYSQSPSPHAVPDELLAERLIGVLSVLYLISKEGCVPTRGDAVVRPELSDEAIRLTRLVLAQLPEPAVLPEAQGLLSLMLLHHARREALRSPDGALIPMHDQDRRTFDSGAISEGAHLLEAAAAVGRPGPYQLQAAIAFLHAMPSGAESVPRIHSASRAFHGLA